MFQLKVTAFILALTVVLAQDCSKPPPHVKPHECCQIPQFEFFHNVFKNCMDQHGGEGKEKFKNFPCVAECAFKELNWLKDGKADREKMMTDMIEKAGDNAELKEMVEQMIPHCVSEDGEPAHGPPEGKHHHPEHESKCDKKPMHMFFCMGMNTIKNCPESMAVASDKCTEFKNHMEQCKPPHH